MYRNLQIYVNAKTIFIISTRASVYLDIHLEIAIHMRSACIILLNMLINRLFLWKEN